MTAPMFSMQCPTQEALAAYVDGRLSPEERAEVVSHLASCADCRDLVLLAIDFQHSEGEAMANEEVVTPAMDPFVRPAMEEIAQAKEVAVKPPSVVPFGKRVLRYAGTLAAAAALVFAFLHSSRPGIDDLVAASAKLPERAVDGRLSGGFEYRPVPKRTRGPGDRPFESEINNYEVLDLAAKMRDDRDPHRRGIALLLADKQLREEGITALNEALAQKPDDPRFMNDLAVALLDRGQGKDYEQALVLANRAWARERTPEAAWNRALALEWSEGREADALQAWKDYLKLDANSKWAQEARQRIANLEDLQRPLQVNP